MYVCVYIYIYIYVYLLFNWYSFVILWTLAHQVPLFMGFPRQEYWSGLPFLLQGIFLIQGLNLHFLHWQANSLPLSHQGSPYICGDSTHPPEYHCCCCYCEVASVLSLLVAFEGSILPYFLTNRILNPLGVEMCPAENITDSIFYPPLGLRLDDPSSLR